MLPASDHLRRLVLPITGTRRDATWLVGLAVIAFAVRLAYALALDDEPHGDSVVYRDAARALADGHGYAEPLSVALGNPQPTAQHPPLFAMYLAAWTRLGIDSVRGHQVACCLLGAVAVVLIGLVGRHVAGGRVGLIAASVAAVYPPLFMLDRSMNSESLYVPLIALALLLAYRLLNRPNAARAAALGSAIGLATLTRSDAILLLPVLVAPLAWRARHRRARTFAVCAAATALVLAPWLARNWLVFERFPLLSTNGGYTARATNCDGTYFATGIGFVDHGCAFRSVCFKRFRLGNVKAAETAEVPRAECLQREAATYVRRHERRVPLVVLARVERVWETYRPKANLDYGTIVWGRPRGMATVGLIFYGMLVPLAIAGAFLLGRSRTSRLPLLAMFAQATLVAALAFGFTRYRVPAEPALVILAAVAVERLGRAGIRSFRKPASATAGTAPPG